MVCNSYKLYTILKTGLIALNEDIDTVLASIFMELIQF